MKSRQKGKKKGSSKERVFGCDLQEHLQHSGQEEKQAQSGGQGEKLQKRGRMKESVRPGLKLEVQGAKDGGCGAVCGAYLAPSLGYLGVGFEARRTRDNIRFTAGPGMEQPLKIEDEEFGSQVVRGDLKDGLRWGRVGCIRGKKSKLERSSDFGVSAPSVFPVPQVLKSCAEFVEEYGVVDGIYRLSGVSSNIQKLR
ncbi:hypothetical protein P7K49_037569 [Saguinus oedipus]|uniref:Rho-GAP domain-containing protein n=1 Tax=Saguinus oedipus TaxID=9490 RepID=A0ABQ9TII3_SAGOE|nr:hypothetical protein P7K49_037569 [Saguinus oedipus]